MLDWIDRATFRANRTMTVRCGWNVCSATPKTMLQLSSSRAFASTHGRAVSCLKVGFDGIAEIAHNKVLIAAGVSSVVGQLAKPFTYAIFYGKGFDLRAVLQPGGFPSSHSSAVVATATSLALERGFSDSIFGLAVVYASLVMYDAQGVRREVGKHAKVINKALYKTQVNPSDLTNKRGEGKSVLNLSRQVVSERDGAESKLSSSNTVMIRAASSSGYGDGQEVEELQDRLKEVVGHTEVEVIAGAFLGFLVALVVNAAST